MDSHFFIHTFYGLVPHLIVLKGYYWLCIQMLLLAVLQEPIMVLETKPGSTCTILGNSLYYYTIFVAYLVDSFSGHERKYATKLSLKNSLKSRFNFSTSRGYRCLDRRK